MPQTPSLTAPGLTDDLPLTSIAVIEPTMPLETLHTGMSSPRIEPTTLNFQTILLLTEVLDHLPADGFSELFTSFLWTPSFKSH